MVSGRIHDLVRECQMFAGESSLTFDATTLGILVCQFVSRLPDTHHPVEHVALSGALMHVALRWATHFHGQFHRRYPANCHFDPVPGILEYWQDRQTPPKHVFAEWAFHFLEAFDRTHPLPAAYRVKELVHARYQDALDVTRLARTVGCHPARLRALFKDEFGIAIHEYQTRLRVLRAVRLLATSDVKVEAVARTVGFRSKRNFYGAFRRLLGLTPSAVRRWSFRDLERLEQKLSARTI